jgi:hypothetical protein
VEVMIIYIAAQESYISTRERQEKNMNECLKKEKEIKSQLNFKINHKVCMYPSLPDHNRTRRR